MKLTNLKCVSDNPHPNAIRLFNYLNDMSGKAIISGHQADHFAQDEWNYIKNVTGTYPAIKGLDFMNSSKAAIENGVNPDLDTNLAIEWWDMGGIVTFCWHWRSPFYVDNNYHGAFYTQNANINLEQILSNPQSDEYKIIIEDIDLIAKQLKRLQLQGVPVLWRPLHEAAGGWFWWGAHGPKVYIQLWKLLFKQLNVAHNLTNLIWVCNCADKSWYPGDEYADIISEDIYTQSSDYSSQIDKFTAAEKYSSTGKIVALSENGVFIDPDNLIKDSAWWSWFMTWRDICSNAIKNKGSDEAIFRKVYSHEYVITKEKLLDLKNYRL